MLSVRLPALAAGTSRSSVVLSPIWPASFPPQQYPFPVVVTPQLWSPPPLTRANWIAPCTAVGTSLPTVVLSPNSPEPLSPQQYAAPAGVTAQVCTDRKSTRLNSSH